MGKFAKQICRLCGVCDATEPYFCSSMCSVDRAAFAKLLKHTMVLRYNDKEKFKHLATFEAMVGRFCNGKNLCKFRTKECIDIEVALKCYEMFLHQSGVDLTIKDRASIYYDFYDADLRTVGLDFCVPKKPFKGLKNKAKKRINSFVDRAIHAVKTEESKQLKKRSSNTKSEKKNTKAVVNVVKSKPITTAFFYSDNEEWRQKIESILGENTKTNEADN